MNEKKVAFICIEGIHGLCNPIEEFSIFVRLYPKGENSPGKIVISKQNVPMCSTTWTLIYNSESDEFILITLNLKNNEYAKLLLPIKWFEVNKVVKETFPMLVTDQNASSNKTKIMMAVSLHRSENGECAFIAEEGHLLVKPEWDTNQIESTHDSQKSTPDIQHQIPQSQQMVYFNPGQPTYIVPIPNTGQNQVFIPMQIQSQFLGQVPLSSNTYQYPLQQFIYAQNGQCQIQQHADQNVAQQLPVDQNQTKTTHESENSEEQKEISQQNDQKIEQHPSDQANQNAQENNEDSKEIDNEKEKENQKNDTKTRNIQLDQENSQQEHKEKTTDSKHHAQENDRKSKKSQKNQDIPKSENKTQKDQNPNNQETSDRKIKKSRTTTDSPKPDQKIKKTQANQDNQKSKKAQQNQENPKNEQKSKKVQLNQDDLKEDQKQKTQPTQENQKVDRKTKRAGSKQQKTAIPVLQQMTVYIKTSDGKLKPMLLIPSTNDTPAQLKPIDQQTK